MVGTSFGAWWRYFRYTGPEKEKEDNEAEKETRSDARNALLVVATLIAAVTFQAGVNPPGGVWQETKNTTLSGTKENVTVIAGTAIFASDSKAYYVFLTSNNVAFSAAVIVIISLTHKFPFKFEVWVAAVSMIITYGSAVIAVNWHMPQYKLILIVAAAPLVMRCLIQLLVKLIHREPEPPRLIKAFIKPTNKAPQPGGNESLDEQV